MPNIVAGPIYVPASFFGLVSQTWPWDGITTGTAPRFPVGRLSNYDNAATHWGSLHTATDTIDWSVLDGWVSRAKVFGVVKGTYCVDQCPTFLATAGTVATTGSNVNAPYGIRGGASYPSSLAQLTYFCQQFAARNISTWGRFFDVVSLFNEPYISASTTPSTSKFFWGTATQYVDMLYTAFAAFTAADPSLYVISPGTFDLTAVSQTHFSGIGTYLTTAGTVNSTKTGKDCFAGMAAHDYHARPDGILYAGQGTIQSLAAGGYRAFQNVLLAAGSPAANGPYHITEYAITSAPDWELDWWNAQTTSYRESFIQRIWMDAMLAGAESICAFSLGNTANLLSNLATDDPGVVSGLRKIYNGVAGKTIVAGFVNADGSRTLNFSDGSTYSV